MAWRISVCLVLMAVLSGCPSAMLPREEAFFFKGDMNSIIGELGPQFDVGKPLSSQQLVFLCQAYVNKAVFAKALKCANDLESALAEGDDNSTFGLGPFRSAPWLVRAEAHLGMGRYEEAIGLADEASRIASEDADSMVGNQLNWVYKPLSTKSIAHAALGEMEQAEAILKILETTEVTFFQGYYARSALQSELFKAYMATENYQKYYESVLANPSFGEDTKDLIHALWGQEFDVEEKIRNQFARHFVEYKLGKLEQAQAGLTLLADSDLVSNFGSIYWKIMHILGNIQIELGNPEEAVRRLKTAVEVVERQRASIESEGGKIGYVGDKQAIYADLIQVLMSTNRYQQAFSYAERGKARALVDLLADRQSFTPTEQGPSEIDVLLRELDTLEQDSLVQVASADGDNTRQAIQAASAQLRSTAPELASLVTVSTLTAAEVQLLLAADEALVEYTYYNGGDLFAFVLTNDSIQAVKLNGNGLETEVSNFRTALQDYQSDVWKTPAQSLYQRLISPLKRHLGARNLLIVPHGALHYLPFNALHDGQEFLIDSYGMRSLPSASVLNFLKDRQETKEGMLIFGNPDLGDPRYNLPGAETEARIIASMIPKSRVVLKKQATESVLKKAAGQFRYLHLASHGQFKADDAMSSRMLLAPDINNDGSLTVGDIYELTLNADLVTLSACETGLGRIANGDDVVGLTRGFLFAGARSIVASLWPVSDQATLKLMTAFYGYLDHGDKRQALRRAQLETRQTYPHPLFWSAFQLTGSN